MSLPHLLSIALIQKRLEAIFPAGIENRSYVTREMAAKIVFVMLYGGMVEGANRYFRPAHAYFYTDEQSTKNSERERHEWLLNTRKQGFRPPGVQWYADTTREPIRDETIRYGLLNIGAVGKLADKPTTSSAAIYYLTADFAILFDPALDDAQFESLTHKWREKYLSPAAQARTKLLAAGALRNKDGVLVTCPDGTSATLSPGLSSTICKAVIEDFAAEFLVRPALLWLSESGNKVRHQDQQMAEALGLRIDAAKVLPDIILVSVGDSGDSTHLVFVEVVATDGPMNEVRKNSLLTYVRASRFPEDQCIFGTAFEDRAHSAFRKCLPTLAWGSFAWFRTEPNRLIWLYDEPIDITT